MAIRERQQSLGGLPVQIDYTARDYSSILSELLTLSETLVPTWTDKQPGDIGVTILEAVAYLGDILSYNLDRTINESYLATAQTRESVIDILRLIGYELQPPSPASVSMVVRTNEDNVVLPVGFTVRTEQTDLTPSLEYELLNSVILPTEGLYCVEVDRSKVIRVFQEQPQINDDLIFVAGETVVEAVGISDGTVDQTYILNQSPICLNADGTSSIQVTVDGDVWEGKTSFLGADPTGLVFVYRVLADQTALIEFGDGVTGAIPSINSSIIATYRVDGGAETNRAGVGSITQFDNIQGLVSVYNVTQPSGGSDEETIENAKKQGPLSLRALDRCVTLGDFETVALQVPGGGLRAAKAKRGDSPIKVNLYIATEGSNPVPSGKWLSDIQNGYGMLGAVGRWLNTKKPVPTILDVLAPTPILPYFECVVYIYNNILRQNVINDVDTNLQNLLLDITSEFGDGIPLSALIQVIENTRGVDYLDAIAFYRVPAFRYIQGNEDSVTDTIVEFSSFNEDTRRGTYRVVWHNFEKFSLLFESNFVLDTQGVKKVYLASEPNIVEFYSESNLNTEPEVLTQFVIDIEVGQTHLPARGDVWEFTVDRYLDNIEAKDYEIIVSPIDNAGYLDSNYFNLTFVGGI
jgi:hypothetical protein